MLVSVSIINSERNYCNVFSLKVRPQIKQLKRIGTARFLRIAAAQKILSDR
jgi:hypothetical protein